MSVVVVGNARSLLDKQLGHTIDAHALVIRCNSFVTRGFVKHVGQRTDIWCVSLRMDVLPRLRAVFSASGGFGFVQSLSEIWFRPKPPSAELRDAFAEMVGPLPPLRPPDPQIVAQAEELVGHSSHGFFAVLLAIARYGAGRVSVTGFGPIREIPRRQPGGGKYDYLVFDAPAEHAHYFERPCQEPQEYRTVHDYIAEWAVLQRLHHEGQITILGEA